MAEYGPYSHSRIQCFKKCPRQFRFRYVDEIPSRRRGVEAFMGSRVHETLEHLYREFLEGRDVDLDALIRWYHQCWDQAFGDDIHVVREERTPEDYRVLGVTCLKTYHDLHFPYADAPRTLGLELLVEFHLGEDDNNEAYPVRGYVDRLVRGEDDYLEIHDYKTSGRMPSQRDIDADHQLALYQLGLGKVFPEQVGTRLVWHYLVHGETVVREKTPAQLEALVRATRTAIDVIQKARDFPARTSALCRWCDYHDICPEGARSVASKSRSSRYEAGLVRHYSHIKEDARRPEADPGALRFEAGLLKQNIRDYVVRSGRSVLEGEAGRLVVKPPESPGPVQAENGRWSIRLES